jgi:endonuclease/exonuclease/phosphatase family metal-dependent hydrolase
VPHLIRSWNVFHGNAVPPERRAYLEQMVRLATADGPDVLCLQEVPVWALARLDAWSGMTGVGAVGARPRLVSAALGRLLTEVHHGLLRSALTGQANAVLVRPSIRVGEHLTSVISRRGEGERRVCLAVRLDEIGLVCNFHATTAHADTQFHRAARFVDELAKPDEPVIFSGDTNVHSGKGHAYDELRGLGFTEPAPGIDQILVRGVPSTPLTVWPDERRRSGGRLLSDHAPVELTVG